MPLSISDDYSRYTAVYTMERKSETASKMEQFIESLGAPKVIRSDNGGEFDCNAMNAICKKHHIRREWTIPYNPEQNGVAERTWRSLAGMTRAMLKDSGMPKEFWPYALVHAACCKVV